MKSIKLKLVLIITILVVILSVCLSTVSFLLSSYSLMNTTKVNLEDIALQLAKTTDLAIEDVWNRMEVLSQSTIICDPTKSVSDKQELLKEIKDRLQLHDLFFIDASGKALIKGGKVLDLADRAYFIESMKGKNYVTSPFQDTQDVTKMIITYTTPVKNGNEIIGVLAWMNDATKLSEVVTGVKVGERGQAFLINEMGTTIAHTDHERVLSSENIIEKAKSDSTLNELADAERLALENELGSSEYTFNGMKKVMGYAKVGELGWRVCANIPYDQALNNTRKLMGMIIMGAIILCSICSIITFIIAKSIARPIEELSDTISILAKGDFTAEVSDTILKRADETGKIAVGVLTLRNQLRGMIVEINKKVALLTHLSSGLDANTLQAKHSMDQIETAVQEIAKGANFQSEETQTATQHVVNISEMLVQTRERTETLREKTDYMSHASKEENEILKILESINCQVKESIDTIFYQTNITNQSVEAIHHAVNLITSIARETNLLSLNASIEAARAGEQGKGFAVVANEIRELAEESNRSAKEIEKIIFELSEASEKAVEAMKDTKQIIDVQTEKVSRTSELFSTVEKGIQEVVTNVEAITEIINALSEARTGVVECVQNLSAVSEENASATEETSATTVEISSVVTQMAQTSKEVQNMAVELAKDVEKFVIE